jgi:hypothetical protein
MNAYSEDLRKKIVKARAACPRLRPLAPEAFLRVTPGGCWKQTFRSARPPRCPKGASAARPILASADLLPAGDACGRHLPEADFHVGFRGGLRGKRPRQAGRTWRQTTRR